MTPDEVKRVMDVFIFDLTRRMLELEDLQRLANFLNKEDEDVALDVTHIENQVAKIQAIIKVDSEWIDVLRSLQSSDH
jgi:hypothetical protein